MAGACLALVALTAGSGTTSLGAESGLSIGLGVAYDDNPFEAPSEPYFDQFDLVIIEPEKSPGWFVPFVLSGDYRIPGNKHRFLLDYRLRHHAYGSGNDNADETYLTVAPGYRMVTGKSHGRESRFFAVPYATYNKEIYFDRDTGIGQTIGFEDASNRYTYLGAGAETGFTSWMSRSIRWEVAGQYEHRNYEDVSSVSSLDQDRLHVRGGLAFGVYRRLGFSIDYTYRILDYEERPSRDLDGGITADETPVKYGYHIVGNTLRFDASEQWIFYFDLDYTGRIDRFEGYNDYHMLGGRVRALWQRGPWRVRAAVRYWERDYPRAFIFDMEVNPGTGEDNPNKAYDIFNASLLFEAPLVRSTRIVAAADMDRQDAADPRYTYDRLRLSVGLKWVFESRGGQDGDPGGIEDPNPSR